MNHPVLAIGDGKIRGDARIQKSAANRWNLAEAPDLVFRIENDGLADLLREGREVEIFPVLPVLGNRDTHVGAAGAFGLDRKVIDARQIRATYPESVTRFSR